MPVFSRLKSFYWKYLSKPAHNRTLYRAISKHRFQRILEIGMGSAERSTRLIQLAQQASPEARVVYTGVDCFELCPEGATPVLSLKTAFRTLRTSGARIRLLPGDVLESLSRAANDLRDMDLIIISTGQPAAALAQAWFYVPRMLHGGTQVYLETRTADPSQSGFQLISHSKIAELATFRQRRFEHTQGRSRRRAA